MNLWLVVLAMGLITFGLRLSLILSANRLRLPVAVEQALRYAPVAVLSAIIFTELIMLQGAAHLSLDNSRLLAAIAAGLVAWRTKNMLLTIAGGMVLFWLL